MSRQRRQCDCTLTEQPGLQVSRTVSRMNLKHIESQKVISQCIGEDTEEVKVMNGVCAHSKQEVQ